MLVRRAVAWSAAAVVGLGIMPVTAIVAPSVTPSAQAAEQITVRFATFNVRTARAKDKRNWLMRAPSVAQSILDKRIGIVALQELGPGRADGVKGKIGGRMRQTESLTAWLSKLGGPQYKLVRTYSYIKPGSVNGTQGSRILYDSSQYKLLSYCPETTGKSNWNASCKISLPIAAGDGEKRRRTGAYAQFAERDSGRKFWVASAHLDERHGSNAKDAKFSALRAAQAAHVANTVAAANDGDQPVFFGGDINSWRTDRSRYAPHRAFEARGFRDGVAAPVRVNDGYATINHFKTTLKKTSNVKLDVVMVKGAKAFRYWENVGKISDSARPSDHNMVFVDAVI